MSPGAASAALVTGAGGLIGRAVADAAGRAGLRVVPVLHAPASGGDGDAIATDLGRDDALDGAPAVDVVLHAAARLPANFSDADPSGAANRAIDDVVLAFAERHRAALVYASSAALYGPAEGLVTERDPIVPAGSYLREKARTEELGREASERTGRPFTALRLTSPYGPDMPPRSVLPRFVDAALAGRSFGWLGTGSREQDFVAAADVAQAFVAAALAGGGTFNIAAGAPVTMRDVALLIAEAAGAPELAGPQPGIDPQDGRRLRVSTEAARERLGWSPALSLRDGVRELLDHRRAAVAR